MLAQVTVLAFVCLVSLIGGMACGLAIAAAAHRRARLDAAAKPKLPWAGRDLSQPFDFTGEGAGLVDSCEHLEARP